MAQKIAADSVRRWKCEFVVATVAAWTTEMPKPVLKEESLEFHIDDVNVSLRRARMIGNAGASDLAVVRGSDLMTFVEMTPTGNVNTTSVFAPQLATGKFKAVHSRHVNIPGGPLPSQYYGFCVPWQ